MLIGNKEALFKLAALEVPVTLGVYAVRALQFPQGSFVEAVWDPKSLEWSFLGNKCKVDEWRYLTPMEKQVTSLPQVKEESLGTEFYKYRLYTQLVFLADVSIMPRTKVKIERECGYDQSITSTYIRQLRESGVEFKDPHGKVVTVTSWGMFDKQWTYRNYEVLKRKLEDAGRIITK